MCDGVCQGSPSPVTHVMCPTTWIILHRTMASLSSRNAWLIFFLVSLRIYYPCMVMASSYEERFIWPLTDSTFGWEVYNNTPQDNGQPGFQFGEVHSLFSSSKALTLDGSKYVDIEVGSSDFIGEDFSLVIHFKQTSYADSTLFHYQSVHSTGGITEFKMSLNGSKQVLSKTAYGAVEMNAFPNSVVLNTWHTLIFCVIKSNGRYESYLDSSSLINKGKYNKEQSLRTPGIIRLGADISLQEQVEGNLFTGAVICMGLFARALDNSDIIVVRSFCNSSHWNYFPSGLPVPSTTTTTPTTTSTPTTTTTPTATTTPTTTTTTPTTTSTPTITTTMPQTTTSPLTIISKSSVGACENFVIERVAVDKRPDYAIESPFDLLGVNNVVMCAGWCRRNVMCSSLTFDTSSKACALYTQTHGVAGLIAVVNETYYRKT